MAAYIIVPPGCRIGKSPERWCARCAALTILQRVVSSPIIRKTRFFRAFVKNRVCLLIVRRQRELRYPEQRGLG